MANKVELKLRILHGEDIAIGPGKVELLEAIVEQGSISAAARAMGMSYRRAWLLVDTMNRCFRQPLVITLAGGTKGGGATLTREGRAVVTTYRTMQRKSETAIRTDLRKMFKMLNAA